MADPARSPRELAWQLTDREGHFLSESSVYRILKAYDLIPSPAFIVLSAAKSFRHPTRRPNELWQTDFTYLQVVGWGWYYLSTVLDDYARYIIAWMLRTSMQAADVMETLDLARAKTGLEPGPGGTSPAASERQRPLLRLGGAGGVSGDPPDHAHPWGNAIDLLRLREGDIAKGVPVSPKIGQLRFEEAAQDILADYTTNARRSTNTVERRLRLHLAPCFGGRRLASLTTSDVRAFVAHRQKAGASNGEVNRELTVLKRMIALTIQGEKLLHKPYIPLLRETNTRTGFFEADQFASVLVHLPAPLASMLEFAYITGWRIPSEILTLQWRQIDFTGGEVRLDPHTTKNDAGRVFPFTDDLRRILEAQKREVDRLAREHGQLVPWVFFRLVANGRGGEKRAKPIRAFVKAWKTAITAAGCPGRVPHDLRRSAVRNMVRRAVPERVAMQLTGHKTRSVFERYNIVSAGDLKDAADRLRGLTGAVRGQVRAFHPHAEA